MDTKINFDKKKMPLLFTSITLKEDSFSHHCLNPFTFEGLHGMCHLIPEGCML